MTMSTAIVTGASRGFGHALTAALARDGWTVIATGRAPARLEATRAIDPDRIVVVRGDVRNPQHQKELVAAAEAASGLHLLIHTASALGPSPPPFVEELAPVELTRIFDVNVVAPLALTQTALPLLR